MRLSFFAAVLGLEYISGVNAQNIRRDPLTEDPALEIVHLYNGQWPTGIAVSSTGRKFSCFPGGLDPANVNHGIPGIFTVAELTSNNTETAYPNVAINTPPGGAVDRLSVPPVTKGLKNYLLGVQSVVIDSEDTLWILDTGRVIDFEDPLHPMLNSTYGGPKLISVDLTTNNITRNIVFPTTSVFSESYINDVRIDRSRGYAYITDSSLEGMNGIVIVNINTGESWRHLDDAPQVHAIYGAVPFAYGDPMYQVAGVMLPTYITFGADGIALSPDGETLYFSVIAGRFLYSVPTAALRANGPGSDTAAQNQIKNLGEKGVSDGMETDTNGIIYAGNVEQDAISMWNPLTKFATVFVRDPRINWVDTMSVASDGYLYFTVNQLNDLFAIYPGTGIPAIDRRQRPFVCFRVKLPNGGTKINP